MIYVFNFITFFFKHVNTRLIYDINAFDLIIYHNSISFDFLFFMVIRYALVADFIIHTSLFVTDISTQFIHTHIIRISCILRC